MSNHCNFSPMKYRSSDDDDDEKEEDAAASGSSDSSSSGRSSSPNPWKVLVRPGTAKFGGESDEWVLGRKLTTNKRKSDGDFGPKKNKVHISEEKMAAQMRNMRITCFQERERESFASVAARDPTLPSLHISEEIKRLPVYYTDHSYRSSFFSKRENNAKALVLWKPPGGSLTSRLIRNLQRKNSEENVDNVNNNKSTPDLNSITGFADQSTEMEL